ncbi:hypothetical protein Tco_1507908, partial [Tanacetum coccineum]
MTTSRNLSTSDSLNSPDLGGIRHARIVMPQGHGDWRSPPVNQEKLSFHFFKLVGASLKHGLQPFPTLLWKENQLPSERCERKNTLPPLEKTWKRELLISLVENRGRFIKVHVEFRKCGGFQSSSRGSASGISRLSELSSGMTKDSKG